MPQSFGKYWIILMFFVSQTLLSQNSFSISLAQEGNFKNLRGSYIDFNFQQRLGSDHSRFFIYFEHGIGINNQGLLYAKTSLLTLYGLSYITSPPAMAKKSNASFIFPLVSLVFPNGLAYNVLQKEKNVLSIVANPVSFDYWKLKENNELCNWDMNLGARYMYCFKNKTAIFVGANLGYQINLGSKKLEPTNYSNSLFGSIKLGYMWIRK